MTVPASPIAIPTVDEIMSTSRKVWVTPDTPAVHVILSVVYATVPLSPTAMHALALPQSMPFKLFVVGDVNSVQPAANAECAEKNVAKIIAPTMAGKYFRIMQEYEIEFLSTLRYAFTTMPYLLPFVMLFGFLTMKVARGDDFAVVMPLVLFALVMWTFLAGVRSGTVVRMSTTLLVGFVALAIFSQCDVVTYSAFGPQLLGAPLVLAVVWTALVCGVTAIAERKIVRENREVVAWIEVGVLGGGIGALWSLVVNPALFAIGVFAYRSSGLYYGVPFLHMAFWSVSVAAGALVFVWLSDHEERALPLGSIAGPLLFVGYATGVCIAVGAWIPAVLGLVLAQLGFRAMYYL